ncbi:hypothetical protein NE237_014306 [Protea cynaroides]|uniref:Uncharacterized protein n=1 Tax=Protea cynaroides TaxID=273540 RepID=A0A9Q0GKP5_9MAGN|nr:hypothetical protein NE237_014306 [Protea cynaroides]
MSPWPRAFMVLMVPTACLSVEMQAELWPRLLRTKKTYVLHLMACLRKRWAFSMTGRRSSKLSTLL